MESQPQNPEFLKTFTNVVKGTSGFTYFARVSDGFMLPQTDQKIVCIS